MTVINKDLYDALIEAGASDEKAVAAAQSEMSIRDDMNDIKNRLSIVETRMAMVEKLQWGIILGVVALVIKSFIL